MAVTSIWPIKGKVENVIQYAANPEKTTEETAQSVSSLHAVDDVIEYAADQLKTEKLMYVSGINCTLQNAVKKFNGDLSRFERRSDRVCYHAYQSFAENEVDAKTANDIGIELAKRLWGDKFRVIVATHCNTGHYHNHFVICASSFVDGSRLDNNRTDYNRMREESDRLCKEYGLSVITHPKDKGMNYGEWLAEQEGKPTLRSVIRAAIDTAIRGSNTKAEFLDAMDQMGFVIDQSGKYPKIKQVGNERFVRFKSLGEGYDIEDIIERIYDDHKPMYPRIPDQEDPRQIFEGEDEPVALMTFVPLFRCYHRALDLVTERPKTNRRIYFLIRQDTSSMRLYVDSARLVTKHNLHTKEDVLNYKQYAMDQIDQFMKERQDARNALKRAQRSGDADLYSQAKYNIKVLTRRLSKLRREVTTCDEVIERSQHVKDNLTRIEHGKFRGKEKIRDEHISRRGRSGRQDES